MAHLVGGRSAGRGASRGSKRRVLASDINPDLLSRALQASSGSFAAAAAATATAETDTPARKSKYGNLKTDDGFDSRKEKRVVEEIELLVRARSPGYDDVVSVEKQRSFVLIPAQKDVDGRLVEREVRYVADLVLVRASGQLTVYDVKSIATRKNRAYVIKRKLMLHVHQVQIIEC